MDRGEKTIHRFFYISTGEVSPETKQQALDMCEKRGIHLLIFGWHDLPELYGPTLRGHPGFQHIQHIRALADFEV